VGAGAGVATVAGCCCGFALHAAAHAQKARAHDDAAVRLEDPGPDHEVGNAVFVLDGDEHHARGGARALANQHQPGEGEEIVVLGVVKTLTHHDLGIAQVLQLVDESVERAVHRYHEPPQDIQGVDYRRQQLGHLR